MCCCLPGAAEYRLRRPSGCVRTPLTEWACASDVGIRTKHGQINQWSIGAVPLLPLLQSTTPRWQAALLIQHASCVRAEPLRRSRGMPCFHTSSGSSASPIRQKRHPDRWPTAVPAAHASSTTRLSGCGKGTRADSAYAPYSFKHRLHCINRGLNAHGIAVAGVDFLLALHRSRGWARRRGYVWINVGFVPDVERDDRE